MFQPNCQAVPWLRAQRLWTRDLLFSFWQTLAHPKQRNAARVAADYEDGVWKNTLDTREWSRCPDLRAYLIPADTVPRIAKLGQNRLMHVRNDDYYAYRLETLQRLMLRHAGDQDTLVELGCGAGKNLFSLALLQHWTKLVGYDISENAITAARQAADHFGVPGVEFDRLDLIDGDTPAFRRLEHRTVFTYYCLEQLKYHTATVIDNLLRHRVQRVLHVEPSFELLSWTSLADWATYWYVRRMDYQDRLLRTLRQYERQGRLRILFTQRLYYTPTLRNDPTLICWEPVEKVG